MARQIRMTGRAYPLFDIAQLILDKPERQQVRWEVIKDAAGKAAQPLYLCALDDSLWLSEEEAVTHLLGRNFDMFYKAEKTATEPPRGTYTFVAQCGMSGTILGPPNYHDYQNKLRKLHSERFARMPFEAFKARVKIVKDEAVVKKWIEDQSTKTEYTCLNVPEAAQAGEPGSGGKTFPRDASAQFDQAGGVAHHERPGRPPIALARLATPVAQRLGGTAPLSFEAGHHLEPAVRQPRLAVLQGQPHGHPCLSGPSAFPGHGRHAGFPRGPADRGIHQRHAQMHAAKIGRGPGPRRARTRDRTRDRSRVCACDRSCARACDRSRARACDRSCARARAGSESRTNRRGE